jgi:hypothetical protein
MIAFSKQSVRSDALDGSLVDHTPNPLPTPDEIAAACAAIRAGWSSAEKRRAMTVRPLPWAIPQGLKSHRRIVREEGE